MKRDLYIWKETYIYDVVVCVWSHVLHKSPLYVMKRDVYLWKRPIYMKRDLYIRRGCLRMISCATQEPFVCDEKRPTCMQRDLYIWKETYIFDVVVDSTAPPQVLLRAWVRGRSKETYIYEKRPIYMKRNLYLRRGCRLHSTASSTPSCMSSWQVERDILIKPVYIQRDSEIDLQMRLIYMKIDIYMWKET